MRQPNSMHNAASGTLPQRRPPKHLVRRAFSHLPPVVSCLVLAGSGDKRPQTTRTIPYAIQVAVVVRRPWHSSDRPRPDPL